MTVSIGGFMDASALTELTCRKEQILSGIVALSDFRPGSLVERFRRCGKPYCHCARPGEKGHGPSYSLTRSVKGKTVTRIIPKDQVKTTRKQIDEYHRFQQAVSELVETNIKICDTKLALDKEKQNGSDEAEKRG